MTASLAVWIVVVFAVVIAAVCVACYELSQAPTPESHKRESK